MKHLFVTTLLLVLSASSVYAAPACDGPNFAEKDGKGNPIYSEIQESQFAEQRLRGMGIDANNTRFWNGCIQTFVTDANGKTKMEFFDPNSFQQVPAN